MAVTNKLFLTGTYLTNSNAILKTIDVNTTARITQATITNTSSSAVSFNLYLCTNSTIVTDPTPTTIMINKTLGAYETYSLYQLRDQILLAGYTIQGFASTTNVLTLRVNGVEFV